MFRSRWFAALMVSAVSLYGIGGCSKPDVPEDDGPAPKMGKAKGTKTDGGAKTAGAGEVLKEPLKSTVKGRVLIDGAPPEMEIIELLKGHPDKACCYEAAKEKDPKQIKKQTWEVDDGGVENVIVMLEAPKGKAFAEKKYTGTVVIDQPFCQYVPHVSVVRPGETVTFKNSATVGHNTKYTALKNEGNFPLAANGGKKEVELKAERKPIALECDVHKWMSGFVWPTDNPYVVTTTKGGGFELKDVPTGVALDVKIWHESNPKFVQAATLTTKEGDNTVEIKLKPN